MVSKLYSLMGTTVAIVLVIAGLWGWVGAAGLSEHASRPEVAFWAIRGGAIAAWAAAQVLTMTFVVDALYKQDRIGEWMRLTAGLVCTAALVGALGLGLMSV